MTTANFKNSQEDLFQNIGIEDLLNSLDEGAFAVNCKHQLIFYNNNASMILKTDIEDFLGKDIGSILYFKNLHKEQIIPTHIKDLASGYKVSNIYEIDGCNHYFENEKIDIYNESGGIKGALYLIRDITKEIQLELALSMEIKLDSLSGLYNSKFFHETIEKELSRCSRYGHDLSILFIDINNFKFFNDKFGHQSGDEIIKLTGESLKNAIRKNIDTAYRYGGDEFTIIMPNTPAKRATIVANRILLNFQNNFKETLKAIISEKTCDLTLDNFIPSDNAIGLSIGITEYKKGKSACTLIKEADQSMYTAKRNNFRTHIHIFNSTKEQSAHSHQPKHKDPVINKAVLPLK